MADLDLTTHRGLWLCVLGADALELLPTDGIGWLGVDLQHGVYDVAHLPGLLRVAQVPVLARAASQDPGHLARVLDTGVAGVIVPGVESPADVESLVAAVRFPPEGRRSTGLTRAVLVGGPERPLLLPMVETRGALETVEEIAAVPGVDGLFVGPYDLSLSLGRPGVTDADVVAGIARVREVTRERGLLAGAFSAHRELDPQLPADLDLVAVDTDITALRQGVAGLLGG
ncbi:HpcH/HpaI aldolase family protein [Ornithinimicrobium tianjinense]|uniref:Aldolase n=1 Tax=Ornithinimicrobium tianjinense TaxID=1195761 RepID=A0A917BTF6_9MICO|nr:aldolase/citrate lyase family protein [Ornithinimicrobium tianjinense]GGF56115.1 aldolase [Ornithinimicrobium tianjinense]